MPLRSKGTLGDFAAALLDRQAPLPAQLARPDASPPGGGYAVHRNGVMTGLTGALKATFPTLLRLIGDENFAALAQLHIARYPPRSPVLHEYGHDLAGHIEHIPQLAHLPFLPDVARVERAWLDAWHAADAPALSPDDLAGLDPDALMAVTLAPHPATRFLALGSSSASLVQLDRNSQDLAGFDPAAPEWALLSRPEVTVRIEVLTEGQAAFLAGLLSGRTLSDAAAAGVKADPDLDLPAVLTLMIGSGAFQTLGTPS